MRRTFSNSQDLCPQPGGPCHRSLTAAGNSTRTNSYLSTGEPELTYAPGAFPLSSLSLTKTLMSLFTKQPTPGNDINGKMQLEAPELPAGHGSS